MVKTDLSTVLSIPDTAALTAVQDTMTPEMRLMYEEFLEIDSQTIDTLLDANRKKGKLLLQISQKPDVYGSVAVLATALGIGVDSLYKIQQFMERYTDQEYLILRDARSSINRRLSWSHVVALLSVADKKLRMRLQRAAVTGNWTSKHLEQVISGTCGGNQRPGAGRTFHKPGTLRDGALNASGYMQDFNRRMTEVWLPMFDEFKELPPDGEQLATREQLLKLLDAEDTALSLCQERRDKTLAVLSRLETALTSKGLLQDKEG